MGDKNRQADYLCSHIIVLNKKRDTRANSRRKQTLNYFFTCGERRVKVCKATFLKTLGIGEKTVSYALHKSTGTGQAHRDQRGKNEPGIKKPASVREAVRQHIRSFPAMEAHYVRANTKRRYFEATLNIRVMHSLYMDHCSQNGWTPVKECYYREVFNTDFNIGFHRPKKDTCNFCSTYENSSHDEKQKLQEQYKSHHVRKDAVRDLKNHHKVLAKERDDTVVVTLDMEAVLCCPKLTVSSLYYRRKLSTYNCTVYNLGNQDVHCYMWHEGTGGRGSSEIASCLYAYINSLASHVKHLIIYSDTCGGQNRNRNLSAMFLFAIQTRDILIDHYYMESGHSQMECDAAHSAIESFIRKTDVYCPTDYYSFVSCARRGKPFKVVVMGGDINFYDFKQLSSSVMSTRNRDVDGNSVQWLKVKHFRYSKDHQNTVLFRYDYLCENFSRLDISMRRKREKIPRVWSEQNLQPLFTEGRPISVLKYNDLVYMCTSLAIPKDYHAFYHNLKHDSTVRDALPEPDVEELE